jgi:hypothetical protein
VEERENGSKKGKKDCIDNKMDLFFKNKTVS